MSPHTAEPQRLYRQIAEQLRALIVQGEFALGQRLPAERELASQLGVSRPSVREALIALEVEGMIEVRTGSGIYIQSCTPKASAAESEDLPATWGPLEVLRARIVVESEVAALAAHQASSRALAEMREGLQQMRRAARRQEVPRLGDEAFHLAIAQACGNSVLLDTVRRCWQARDGLLFARLGDHFENPETWRAAIVEHEHVLQAIEARDAPAARKAMARHLKQAHKRYSASWRRAPAVTP